MFSAISPAVARDSSSLAVNPESPPSLARQDAAPLQSPRPPSPPSENSSSSLASNPKQDGALHNDSPQPRFTIDPEGHLTHDKTTVDIITVPCPGGHPLRSWNRDGLMSRYYGALSMRDAEVKDDAERPTPSWVRQGIRREADKARILLYEHPEMEEGVTLHTLADELLQNLQHLREMENDERPILFNGHSLGGLVVKMALVKASRDARYENIVRQCYGVAFFWNTASRLELLFHTQFGMQHSIPAATILASSYLGDGPSPCGQQRPHARRRRLQSRIK
ncbi:hypothetical protein J3459_010920 [Metarhizium acridum]|nr:hypothetical protein J3459_010920 [Metarhizium acridum]